MAGVRVRSIVVAVLIGVVALGLTAGPAIAVPEAPFDTNAECLECHDVAAGGPVFSTVDFSTSAVDYDACSSCHWIGMNDLIWGRWGHSHITMDPGSLCSDCHYPLQPYPNLDHYYTPTYPTPYGIFDTADSLSTSAEDLHAIHVNGSWPQTQSRRTNYCGSCHAPAGCDTCHTDGIPHGEHSYDTSAGAYVSAPVSYPQAQGTTPGIADQLNYPTLTVTCASAECHTLAPATQQFPEPACSTCHAVNVDTHGYETVDHVADVAAQADPDQPTCGSCHQMDLMSVHEEGSATSAGGGCSTCHPVPRDSFGVWDQGCEQGGCHAAGSPTERHTGADAAHVPASAGAICLDCHAGPGLPDMHSSATTVTASGTYTDCGVCHNPEVAAASNDCTVCHFTFDDHYDPTMHTSSWTLDSCDDAGCHSTRDLMDAHAEKNPAFECADCHDSVAPAVESAIAVGDTACDACHAGVTETEGHRALHWADPALVSGDPPAPNYSYYTGSAGTAPTSDCSGCHTGNLVDEHTGVFEAGQWTRLPRYDSSGAALGCASCHSSLDAAVSTAIVLGQTACDSCHVVHGPMEEVHASEFADVKPIECTECHSSNLSAEHVGVTVVTSTGTLSGCAVCHSNYEGARGAEVQSAISVTNDTRCTACHAEYHAGSTSHLATSVASVDDCGRCHGAAAGQMDVQVVHLDATQGSCDVCHANPARVPDISATTAECASCHAVDGVEYHRDAPAAHTFDGAPAYCTGSGCHATMTLPALHASYASASPDYVDECELCHMNADPTRIDWTTASADCSTCHDVHPDLDGPHVAPGSQECVDCHEVADVRELHGADAASSCAICHNDTIDASATTACANCHAYSPVDPAHYPSASHAASEPTECSTCHYTDLKSEHFKAGSGPVGCVDCHELSVDAFGGAWDDTCAACHGSRHSAADAAHMSPNTTCAGAGCHVTGDVTLVHAGLPDGGCSACHDRDTLPASADCVDCHDGHGDITAMHTAPASQECVDCHETADVRELHGADSAASCVVCHNGTVNLPETTECSGCHDYSPADVLHYDAALHTAVENQGCANCHHMEMDAEHAKPNVGPVTCVDCHELEVDTFTAEWDSTCAVCHDTRHNEMSAKHVSSSAGCDGSGCHDISDVSAVHAGGSSGGGTSSGTVQLFSDGFESGLGVWTNEEYWRTTSSNEYAGSYAAIMEDDDRTASLEKRFDAQGAESLEISFWLKGTAYTESADWVRVYVRDAAGSWRQVWQKTLEDRNTSWEQISISADAGTYGPFDSDSGIRIQAWVSYDNEFQMLDDVVVNAQMPGDDTPVDADDATGCDYCHISADAVPTTTVCEDCHGAGGHELREPMGTCASSGCHSTSEVHNESDHERVDCTSCHGEAAVGCVTSGCHDFDEVHYESDHPDCEGCHVSGIDKPHATITTLTTITQWRAACLTCHSRTHSRRDCTDCHASGGRADVHDYSYHWRESACGNCHTIAAGDTSLSCTLCHRSGS